MKIKGILYKMAVQSGSTIYASDVNSYINVSKNNLIYTTDINSYVSVTRGNPIYASEMNKVIEILSKKSIGGKIFYDAGDNGATYTFYDSNDNIISDTSISGLQNAVYYKKLGISTKDRYYAVYPSKLNDGNDAYWGFYNNTDINSSGGNIVNTGTAIGTGKTATQAILNYIDTYASNETASSSRPSSYISQASPKGYNLYKNCGTSYNYLWDVIRDANNNSLEGHNDWFVPSMDEMYQISTSDIISNITTYSNYIWSGSADSYSDGAWYWNGDIQDMRDTYRRNGYSCVVCRAF